MNKEYSQAGRLVAVALVLGFTALLVCFVAAAAFETGGGTSNGELIAPCVAAALYLAFCQFWVAPRGRGRFWAKWLTAVASVAPLLLSVNWHRRAWGIPWVLVSGGLGSVIGAMIAQRVTATPQGGTQPADSSNRGRSCRRNLLAGFILLVAVALLISIGVIPSVLADTASGFNAGPTGKFLGVTVVFDLLASAILASALWRPRERDPSSKGTLGTTAFLALFLTLVYCPIGILVGGHGPDLRIASVVLVLCAVCGLITSTLMIVTSIIVDRARLCPALNAPTEQRVVSAADKSVAGHQSEPSRNRRRW
jgi:hypothetical protein